MEYDLEHVRRIVVVLKKHATGKRSVSLSTLIMRTGLDSAEVLKIVTGLSTDGEVVILGSDPSFYRWIRKS